MKEFLARFRLAFWILLVLAVLALTGYFLFLRPIVYEANIVIDGDLAVGRRAVVMKGGATLTVKGALTVNGTLACKDGPLSVAVENNLVVKGRVLCKQTKEDESFALAPEGINIISGGSAEFEPSSIIAANGHIQIVADEKDLLTADALDEAFDETITDSTSQEAAPQFGPLLPIESSALPTEGNAVRQKSARAPNGLSTQILIGTRLPKAHAQEPVQRIRIGGTLYVGSWGKAVPKNIDVKKLPKGIKRVIVRAYFPNGEVEFRDKTVIYAPDGLDGPDFTSGCDVNVPEQESESDRKARDAMRMRVEARSIAIGEVDLYLGDGGRGGNATTDKDCDPGKAVAGAGGQSGNFKMNAAPDGSFKITGPFRIHPGRSGDGGTATAYGRDGKDGEVGENGKAAIATGGTGADNIKALRARGVGGLANIFIDSLYGGNGGDGIANPGNGGDSTKCDTPGGLPGAGGAVGGAGGIARLDYPPAVQNLPGAQDVDGSPGRAIVNDAQPGKDGPPCAGAGAVSDRTVVAQASGTPTPALSEPGAKKSDATAAAPTKTPTPAVALPSGYFEFLDAGYERTATLPSGAKVHIIVASTLGNPDMRTKMPITLEFMVDGQVIWTGVIQGDPTQVCRGADGCSMDGPVVDPSWVKKQLKATGKNGEILATYSEN